MNFAEKNVCITGAGQSAVGRPSDRKPLKWTHDACLAALEDAGPPLEELDG